jgi:hypothetical protein
MKSPIQIFHNWLPQAFGNLAAAVVLCSSVVPNALAKEFSSPVVAMDAFGDAILNDRQDELRSLFGDNYRDLIPPAGADVRKRFIDAWRVHHAVQQTEAEYAHIAVGDDGWTLPIPLVKTALGWHFDTRAGADEMRLRRIGRNELAVIRSMLAICEARRKYALTDRDGEGLLAYASKLVDSPDNREGSYSPGGPDAGPNSLSAAFVNANTRNAENAGYYGYHYKLLESQGVHAPGGAYAYIADDKLSGGFAVVAWPVRYGDTGIKSFTVSHAGQVYERDLGPDETSNAEAMKSFDPGPGWAKVAPRTGQSKR